ncbi:MAG: ATP-binding protein [Deltaproteobacteria bacterium]|nr:ATP-binding protein [Deltaproteobacteria bacterium]
MQKSIFNYIEGASLTLRFKACDLDPDKVSSEIGEIISKMNILTSQQKDEFVVATIEALLNARDHGCFELNSKEKGKDLYSPNTYEDKRQKRMKDPKLGNREVQVSINIDANKISIQVKDPGHGIPKKLSHPKDLRPYGMGIKLMRKLADRLIIKQSPSRVILVKYRRSNNE